MTNPKQSLIAPDKIILVLAIHISLLANLGSAAQIMGINDGVLWLDASTLNLSNGATVNTWTNNATGGGIAGNAILDNSDPAFVADAFSGHPAVAFDSGNGLTADPNGDSMRVDNFQTNFVDNKQFTVFIVSLADNSSFGITPTDRSGSINRLYPRRGGLTYQTGNPTPREDIAISSINNQLEITTFRHTGSQIEAWLNGESQGTASIGLGNIGGNQSLYLSWWPGNVPQSGQLLELMWFERSLTEQEFNTISNYLENKYFPVPEPSSGILLFVGAIFVARVRRRQIS